MKKLFFATAVAAAFVPALSSGQNLNPTVDVTRDYEVRTPEIRKPLQSMNIPDSVLRFNMAVDYSVFDNPYGGSYDFSPYLINVRPDVRKADDGKFYFRLGGGFPLHPEGDIVFSPRLDGPFRFSIYGHHLSYLGKYHGITPDGGSLVKNGESWDGRDMTTKAGLDGLYAWKNGLLTFDASFGNLMVKDNAVDRMLNSGEFNLRAFSENGDKKGISYDVRLSGRFGADSFKAYAADGLNEGGLVLDASVGGALRSKSVFSADVHADVSKCDGSIDDLAGTVSVTGKYSFSSGIFHLDLGGKLSVMTHPGGNEEPKEYFEKRVRGQFLYPDVRLSLTSRNGRFSFYIKAEGGDRFNSYSDMLRGNSHFHPLYGIYDGRRALDHTVERINAAAGVRVGDASVFQLDLSGGYSNVANGLLDGWKEDLSVPVIGYADYGMVYADLFYAVKSHTVDFNGHVSFKNASMSEDAGQGLFKPAMFSGDMELTITAGDAVKAGLSCRFSSSREALNGTKLPGYADFGVFAETPLTKSLSLWAKGSNLLGMTVQRVPGFAEKGAWATGGICLNF